MSKPQIIAFYLPQFYPTPENDEWWEPGFTEWTNVARAKPLFKGHYQPRIPRDLSFYDLRVPEVREKQAELAQEAGIDGFCYWHYWFGNGKRLLADVFKEVVETGKPDFPFCLCWANHSWYQKTWDPNKPNKLLIEQTYPGKEDYIAHFNEMLPAFKDPRYMRTEDGRLIFGFFDATDATVINEFIDTWNNLAIKSGLIGFEFFGLAQGSLGLNNLANSSCDRIVYDPLSNTHRLAKKYSFNHLIQFIKDKLGKPIRLGDYKDYIEIAIDEFKNKPHLTPCINPMFDHSPRSANRGMILHNNNPKLWGKLCRIVHDLVLKKSEPDKIIFIKAWNEWGEGNYLEPDHKFGKKYIEEAGRAFKTI